MTARDDDDLLAFTVGTVWREERVSCPHPDLLRAYETGSLREGAMEFLAFHLGESQCPYCNAVLEDIRLSDQEASQPRLTNLRDKLMRSTVAAVRQAAGRS